MLTVKFFAPLLSRFIAKLQTDPHLFHNLLHIIFLVFIHQILLKKDNSFILELYNQKWSKMCVIIIFCLFIFTIKLPCIWNRFVYVIDLLISRISFIWRSNFFYRILGNILVWQPTSSHSKKKQPIWSHNIKYIRVFIHLSGKVIKWATFVVWTMIHFWKS